jgi:hypothetical protein
MRIRDSSDSGSGMKKNRIRDKHPRSATLLEGVCYVLTQSNTKCKWKKLHPSYCIIHIPVPTVQRRTSFTQYVLYSTQTHSTGVGVAVHPLFHVSVHPDNNS